MLRFRHAKRVLLGGTPRRLLHLHEHQSKELMESFGISTQRFVLVNDPEEASSKARALRMSRGRDCPTGVGAEEFVVKAQVLAGGRGRGHFSSGLRGGVQLTRQADEVARLARLMLGHRLTTHQTGSEGVTVHTVMVAEAKDLARETYFAIVLDRAAGGPVMVACPSGGIDIEHVAETTPHLILKERIDPAAGPSAAQLARIVTHLGLDTTPAVRERALDQISRLYRLFLALDATQVEVNPFGVTSADEVICFDAKISFDENAAFRQRDLFALADHRETDSRELAAQKLQLNYIGLGGNIGCLVNGAGLAMATMDLLKLHGGDPANFLDVGGSAQPQNIAAAYSLLLSDPRVQCVFVNIFGGIVRCDLVAEGILRSVAARASQGDARAVPLVVRLAGTNEHFAKERLVRELPGQVHVFEDLDLAAQHAVHAAASPLLN